MPHKLNEIVQRDYKRNAFVKLQRLVTFETDIYKIIDDGVVAQKENDAYNEVESVEKVEIFFNRFRIADVLRFSVTAISLMGTDF